MRKLFNWAVVHFSGLSGLGTHLKIFEPPKLQINYQFRSSNLPACPTGCDWPKLFDLKHCFVLSIMYHVFVILFDSDE